MRDASTWSMHLEGNQVDQAAMERVRSSLSSSARLPADLAPDDAIAAVMCALVDRLTAGETHHLFEALPGSLRSLFATCVRHRIGQPTTKLDHVDFLERVAEHLAVTPAHAEIICEAVFDSVRNELPDKLVGNIAHQLPRGLQELWLSGRRIEAMPVEATLSAEEARRAVEEEIAERTRLPEGVTSCDAFSAVMCTLAQRVSGGEARELLLGLPATMRGLVERCARHRSEESDVFGREELLRRVAIHLRTEPAGAEPIVCAVFGAVKRVLPGKATFDIGSQLPVDLRELWEGA